MSGERRFRCPSCEALSGDETAGARTAVLICENCGDAVHTSDLIAGSDGVFGIRPDPENDGWCSSFWAVYPDGARELFDSNDEPLRQGDALPGTRFCIDRWQLSEEPVQGRFDVVAILKEND